MINIINNLKFLKYVHSFFYIYIYIYARVYICIFLMKKPKQCGVLNLTIKTTTVLKIIILQTMHSAVLAVYTTTTNLESAVKTVLLAGT